MAQTASNVSASKPPVGGALSRAATGTTLPTDAVTALATGFVGLGYISDAGVTNARGLSATDIKAWGGDTVLTTQDSVEDTFSLTLIEATNVDVLKAVYGASSVSGALSTGISVSVNGSDQAYASWVIDMVLKGSTLKRIVIPSGKITAIEDITYEDSGAIGYGITITATPDASGNTHYEYIKAAST